jgi:hypothetical protein
MTNEDFTYYENLDRLQKEYEQHNMITGNCDIVYKRLFEENKLIITGCEKFSILLYFICN